MKICQEHWDRMRAKVDAIGLGHLCAATAEGAVAKVRTQLEEAQKALAESGDAPDGAVAIVSTSKQTADGFDPLLDMNWAFHARALEQSGPGVLMQKDDKAYEVEAKYGVPRNDGHFCPLCLAKIGFLMHAQGEGGRCGQEGCDIVINPGDTPWDENWIEGCGNYQLERAKELGAIKLS